MILTVLITAFFVLCGYAAYTDSRRLQIPNWINGTLFALFLPAALLAGMSWAGIGIHIAFALLVLVITFTLFAFNLFGGGDAKMIPAVLVWLGPSGGLDFVFSMALAGGALALTILLLRKRVPAELAPGFASVIFQEKAQVPYGIAICAGAIYASKSSPVLASFVNQFGYFA